MLLIPCVIVMAITSNCFYELYNPPHPGPPDPITLTVTVTVMHIVISNFVASNEVGEVQLASGLATDYYPQDCDYALAYVFQFISNTFVIPFVLLTAMVTGESLCSRWPYASKIWMEICPLLLRTTSKIPNSRRSRGIICRVKTAGYWTWR